jgi:hypothetical protein
MATGIQDRNGKLGEYLELLHSMAYELDRSMEAIAHNALVPLEDSIASQQCLAARLHTLAGDLSKPAEPAEASPAFDDQSLMRQIHAAAESLQRLNERYAALLKLSSHSVGLMISLFSSYRGQIQEETGAGLKHQTWSCQV